MNRLVTHWIAPTTLVLLAGATTAAMVHTASDEPEVAAPRQVVPRLAVTPVVAGSVPWSLDVVGEVQAAQDVPLLSEVPGTLTWVDPGVHAGMTVSKGQVVARLDPTTLRAQLAEAEATLAAAEETLALEQGQGSVAALEAHLVGPVPTAHPGLLRREPQLAAAQAAVTAASAALADARRQLAQTSLRAPFDAILAEEALDPGRIVTTSTELGRWVGTAQAEVMVSVPPALLGRMDPETTTAEVRLQGVSDAVPRTASDVVPTGVVDPTTRTATVLVRVDDPQDPAHGPRLLPGSFASVRLVGTPFQDALALPTSALVDGQAVWTVSAEDTIHRTPVQVLWQQGETVIVSALVGVDGVLTRPSGTLLDGQSILRHTPGAS